MKSLKLDLKQDLTIPNLKKYLLVQEEAGKKPVEVNCESINMFIRNNVLALVVALRYALEIIAMLQAKSPIWPQNKFPGFKMNLQA